MSCWTTPLVRTTAVMAMVWSLSACDDGATSGAEPEPAATTTTTDATPASPADTGRRGYEIPIQQMEFWDPQKTILKYTYEMRFDQPGPGESGPRLHRNGWARAYYGSGRLEREGAYRWNPEKKQSERVGSWTYYETDGSTSRVEDRGGEPIWTGPDQRIAPPGTPPLDESSPGATP